MDFIAAIRQYHILNYAIFDLVLAFGGMLLIAPFLSKAMRRIGVEIPEINWVILALPIGIAVHMLIGVFTPMTKNFLDPSGHIGLKIVIIALLVLGLRGIKLAVRC